MSLKVSKNLWRWNSWGRGKKALQRGWGETAFICWAQETSRQNYIKTILSQILNWHFFQTMLADIVKRGLLTARGVVGFWRANSKVLATLRLSLDCKSIPSSLLRATMSWCSTTLERTQQRSTVSDSRWLKTWERTCIFDQLLKLCHPHPFFEGWERAEHLFHLYFRLHCTRGEPWNAILSHFVIDHLHKY